MSPLPCLQVEASPCPRRLAEDAMAAASFCSGLDCAQPWRVSRNMPAKGPPHPCEIARIMLAPKANLGVIPSSRRPTPTRIGRQLARLPPKLGERDRVRAMFRPNKPKCGRHRNKRTLLERAVLEHYSSAVAFFGETQRAAQEHALQHLLCTVRCVEIGALPPDTILQNFTGDKRCDRMETARRRAEAHTHGHRP